MTRTRVVEAADPARYGRANAAASRTQCEYPGGEEEQVPETPLFSRRDW